jgi:adenosylcobyric acid synthase
MKALMVQGTSSWAGKSLLATALARLAARRGIAVAPFKAQNMSNNARVVSGGGEIGVAQWLQARAAGVEPEVRMNPVLIKPEADARSQVVVLGRPDLALSRRAWRERPSSLWPVIERSLRSLAGEYELLIIEGAGSPAEINLQSTDLANMRVARRADARVALVADIERGGAFAHLYGTWSLLDAEDRARLCGFVLNKFRGDASLLAPGPSLLHKRTGVPVVGVVPRIEHGLPDEDGAAAPGAAGGRPRVAVVRYPTASNLDEFKALEQVADVAWVTTPDALAGAELVVLPGSKHVAADLAWLRARGFAAALGRAPRVLGVCGGMQMLGERIEDAAGVDGSAVGLGLLALRTTFAAEKATRRATARFGALDAPWAALRGLEVTGYEIRHGTTVSLDGPAVLGDDLGFAAGPVLGVYLHGLFEQPDFVRALLGVAPARSLDEELDRLADAVEPHIDVDHLLGVRA